MTNIKNSLHLFVTISLQHSVRPCDNSVKTVASKIIIFWKSEELLGVPKIFKSYLKTMFEATDL
jgi:hypothetical protein